LQINRDFDTKGAETGGSHVTSQRVQIEWHTAYRPKYLETIFAFPHRQNVDMVVMTDLPDLQVWAKPKSMRRIWSHSPPLARSMTLLLVRSR